MKIIYVYVYAQPVESKIIVIITDLLLCKCSNYWLKSPNGVDMCYNRKKNIFIYLDKIILTDIQSLHVLSTLNIQAPARNLPQLTPKLQAPISNI